MNRMAKKVCVGAGAMLLLAGVDQAGAVTLYDGSLGTAPQSQPWLEFTNVGGATATTSSTETTLNTTASSLIEAGYSNCTPTGTLVNNSYPAMNPATGFDVDLTAKVDSESHSSNDRGGFALIALGSDHKGIELDFWGGDVWAQSGPSFTHAEDATFTTTDASHVYDVRIANGNYTLYADGNSILTGVTRDYSSFGLPYSLSNYVFIGDDTTAANSQTEISNLTVAVPEPASGIVLLGTAGMALLMRRQRRG
jgi:hypothetical protein